MMIMMIFLPSIPFFSKFFSFQCFIFSPLPVVSYSFTSTIHLAISPLFSSSLHAFPIPYSSPSRTISYLKISFLSSSNRVFLFILHMLLPFTLSLRHPFLTLYSSSLSYYLLFSFPDSFLLPRVLPFFFQLPTRFSSSIYFSSSHFPYHSHFLRSSLHFFPINSTQTISYFCIFFISSPNWLLIFLLHLFLPFTFSFQFPFRTLSSPFSQSAFTIFLLFSPSFPPPFHPSSRSPESDRYATPTV